MKEYPIIFNSEMVKAILDGRKTQTRRPVKPQIVGNIELGVFWDNQYYCAPKDIVNFCPYGKHGDNLWVRETFALINDTGNDWEKIYKATPDKYFHPKKWTPSIHMPRWASRITLEITAVRCERVQEISCNDCTAEGIDYLVGAGWFKNKNIKVTGDIYTDAFSALWDSIYDNGLVIPPLLSWNANPWVWVIEFKQMKGE